MATWKKIIVSGSNAEFNSATASFGFFGTASWAQSSSQALTASYTPNALVTASVSSNVLTFTKGNGTTFNLTVDTGSGGGGTPGGSNTQIQFNSGSTFNGSAFFTYNYQSESLQQGNTTSAPGLFSHAEGYYTQAIGNYSHAEGISTISGYKGYNSTDIGASTPGDIYLDSTYGDVTSQFSSFIILNDTNLGGVYGTIKLFISTVSFNGTNTVITLNDTSISTSQAYIGSLGIPQPTGADQSIGLYSHAEGNQTQTIGLYSHAEGIGTITVGDNSHAEGNGTTTLGQYSHAEGNVTQAIGNHSHAEGESTQAKGNLSHAEGVYTQAIGGASHAEGDTTQAIGNYSHAEGAATKAIGAASHAEGDTTIAIGDYSHAEGYYTSASANHSHAEGNTTQAIGQYSHTEGEATQAIGVSSHAEGIFTQAIGGGSHAEGRETVAYGNYSHVGGFNTIASGSYQTVYGQFNALNNTTDLFVIGGGSSNLNRKDVLNVSTSSVTISGSVNISGSLLVNGSPAGGGGTPLATLVQSTPSNTWIFNHNLGITNPIVTVYDSSNKVIIPQEISASNTSSLTITFPTILTGTAVAAGGTYVGTTPTNAITASYVLNAVSSSFASTASLAPNYVLNSATSSMLSPYVLSSVTSSMLSPYVLSSVTASMLSPYALSSTLSSYVLNSATSSLATTGSNTFNGDQTINGDLIFNPPTSPGFNGEIVKFGAGTLTTGQLYFLSSSGTWSLANANSTGSSTGMLGLAVGSSPTTNGLLIRGFAASSSYTYGTGSIVYMATGSGIMTATSPSSSNHVVRVMGYQTTLANTIYFDPDKTWVTLA